MTTSDETTNRLLHLSLRTAVSVALLVVLTACSDQEPTVVSQGTSETPVSAPDFRDPEIDPIARGELPAMTASEVETMQLLRSRLQNRFQAATNNSYVLIEPEVLIDSEPNPWYLQMEWLDEILYLNPKDPGAESTVATSEFRGYEVSQMRLGGRRCGTRGEIVVDDRGWIDFYAYVHTGTRASLTIGCTNSVTDFPELAQLLVQYTTGRFQISELDDNHLEIEFANGIKHTYQKCDASCE